MAEREEGRRLRAGFSQVHLRRVFEIVPQEAAFRSVGAELLVGQERPRQELIDFAVQSPIGSVAIISEPLGTGKSSLVQMVRRDLATGYGISGDESPRISIHGLLPEDASFQDAYQAGTPAYRRQPDSHLARPKVVFLEEFDRKEGYQSLEEAMTKIGHSLGTDFERLLLTGDYSLRNPNLIRALGVAVEPKHIHLDPLTPATLKLILERRIQLASQDDLFDEYKIGELDMEQLFDPEFLAHLVPNTDPPSATVRNTLALLDDMAKVLPLSLLNPGQFSGDLYIRYKDKQSSREKALSALEWEFIRGLENYINTCYEQNIAIRASTAEELQTVAPLKGRSIEEYQRFLHYQASRGVLRPLGVTFLKSPDDRVPGPFLPGQGAILDAFYDPLPPISPSEEAKEKQIAQQQNQRDMLLDLYLTGKITQEDFERRYDRLK